MLDLDFKYTDLTFVLASRDKSKYGVIKNVDRNTVSFSLNMNSANEIGFDVYREYDGVKEDLWDLIIPLKLIYCVELKEYYQIDVSETDDNQSKKVVTGTSLCESELSQISLYNVEINSELDIKRDDYILPTTFYNPNDPKISLLNRILDKAPHYTIGHVDDSLMDLQRTFSIDGTTIYDFLIGECAEQFNCLFKFDSTKREISAYDLYTRCNNEDCGYRADNSEFVNGVCPICGNNYISYYGRDTNVFVDNENLTNQVQLTTDTDSIKNSFKLVAGDDTMTAAVVAQNPNGSDYIYYFSDDCKNDMPKELVDRLDSYDLEYKQCREQDEIELDNTIITRYNNLLDKIVYNDNNYIDYYREVTAIYDTEGEIIKDGNELSHIPNKIIGYDSLMDYMYQIIDFGLFLESSMMPASRLSVINATTEAKKIKESNMNPISLSTVSNTTSSVSVESALKNYSKVFAKSGYVKIDVSTLSWEYKGKVGNISYGEWKGYFKITNYSDETDICYSYKNGTTTNEATAIGNPMTITVNTDYENFLKQKINKKITNYNDTDETGLFDLVTYSIVNDNYDIVPNKLKKFKAELKKYGKNRLQSFYDATQAALDILVEAGEADDEESAFYRVLYHPYYTKLLAISDELDIREEECKLVSGVSDDDGNYILDGLYQLVIYKIREIQDYFNIKTYLGDELYTIFCSYRREDKYENSNFISTDLNNSEIFANAKDFIEYATREIHKAGTPQHSISTTLDNLFSIKEFEPLRNSFDLGNWIRVRVDNTIYRLRLINIQFNLSSISQLGVTFSDVTTALGSISDLNSILSQAKSMASSYGFVSQQANNGNNGYSQIDNWVKFGLNSAKFHIMNNKSEEITQDTNGILARSYDDVEDTYSPEQLKITHNILCFTDDNWETVCTALGKHEYHYYNESTQQFEVNEGYGLTSQFVTSGYIYGAQIIGGQIYSQNYDKDNKNGTHINLVNGTCEFYHNGNESFTLSENGDVFIDGTVNEVTIVEGNIIDADVTNPHIDGGNLIDIDSLSLATNYITFGRKRLYISDTAPTGNIPAGSIGIGW